MNDRIKELALDAGLLNYVDHETPRRYFIDGNADQENVEKFAELIMKECVKVMWRQIRNTWHLMTKPSQSAAIYEARNDIHKHFGVEHD